MTDSPRKVTLTQALLERGYAHRLPTYEERSSIVGGARTVYRVDTGEAVGVMDAAEAWAWLRQEAKTDA